MQKGSSSGSSSSAPAPPPAAAVAPEVAQAEEPFIDPNWKYDYLFVFKEGLKEEEQPADEESGGCFSCLDDPEGKKPFRASDSTYAHVNDYKDFANILRARKLWVDDSQLSGGQDSRYVKVGAPEEMLLAMAEKQELNFEMKEEFGGGDAPYTRENHERFLVRDSETGSVLKASVRQQLVMMKIKESRFSKKIKELRETQIIQQVIILHDREKLDKLKKRWALAFFSPQPLEDIRGYFGEKIAMYFAWLGFYTTWLIAPAIAGVVVLIAQFGIHKTQIVKCTDAGGVIDKLYNASYTDSTPDLKFCSPVYNNYDGVLTPIFVIFLSMWATLFIENWKRRSVTLAFQWGTMNFEESEVVREEYRFKERKVNFGAVGNRQFQLPLKISLRKPKDAPPFFIEKYYPVSRRMMAYGISVPTILVIIIACIVSMVLARLAREVIIKGDASPPAWLTLVVGQLNTVILIIFNIIYGKVANRLTDGENHRTQTEYENALIIKYALFQFVNSYGALLIIALWPYPSGSPDDTARVQLMFFQLLTIQLNKLIVDNFREIGIPLITGSIKRWKERREMAAASGEKGGVLSDEDEQASQSPYESPFDDYAEMVIQFGYVVMFAAGFPLGALISVINNFFEIRIDAYKLCTEVQRPPAIGAESIGTWLAVLEGLTTVSIIFNSVFLAMTSYSINLYYGVPDNDSNSSNLRAFIIVEHALLGFMVLLKFLVPDVPKWIDKELALQAWRKEQLLAEQAEQTKNLEDVKVHVA